MPAEAGATDVIRGIEEIGVWEGSGEQDCYQDFRWLLEALLLSAAAVQAGLIQLFSCAGKLRRMNDRRVN